MIDENRNIQMTPAICTQCGAAVNVDPRQEAAVCRYCGTPFIIEKAINNYNIQNATVKHVDSINIVQTGTVESVLNFADKQIARKAEEKKRIAEEARIEREKSDASFKKYWWVYLAVFVGLLLMIYLGTGNEPKDSTDKLRVNVSSSDLAGKNYEDVITDLDKAGFTNIELEVIDDLVTGWLTKDGEVDNVEIDGYTTFSSDSEFEADVEIVIVYHTFHGQTAATTTEDQALVTEKSSTTLTTKVDPESAAVAASGK